MTTALEKTITTEKFTVSKWDAKFYGRHSDSTEVCVCDWNVVRWKGTENNHTSSSACRTASWYVLCQRLVATGGICKVKRQETIGTTLLVLRVLFKWGFWLFVANRYVYMTFKTVVTVKEICYPNHRHTGLKQY